MGLNKKHITEQTTFNEDYVYQLNEEFRSLSLSQRLNKAKSLFAEDEIMMTSSFGTKSVFLLHYIHRYLPNQRIYFLDTKFHFKETYEYKELLRTRFNLNVTYIYPDKNQHDLTSAESWWKDHPRMCCTINKIAPLEPYIKKHKLWISGLMRHQTSHRSRLRIFELNGDIMKFYPVIDIEDNFVEEYVKMNNLPKHPLVEKGYGSVGCTHCTVAGNGRSGRWNGTMQKECGLHLNYFYQKGKKQSQND